MHFPMVVLQTPNLHCGRQSVQWNDDVIMTAFANSKGMKCRFVEHTYIHNTSTLTYIHTITCTH